VRRVLSVLALLLVAGCADGETSAGPDDVETPVSPYARWANGPSTDPSYFPIAVWLQSPANATRYQEIGVNLYIGLWQGPTAQQLSALSAVGMRVICEQNETGLEHVDDPIIAGWMHGDEPDNAQALPEGGYGPAVDPAVLQADYEEMTAADPTRPVFLNLGQGVANEEWVGRGGPRENYPRYVATTDIVSYDVYPVSGIRRDDGERFLWWVAKGVDSLRHWAADGQPVWNVIETTRINSERGPTPAQVRSEVWMSIVAGSTGIVYFCHEWNPVFREARLLEDDEMRVAVGQLNEQIQRLAPVLNAPTVEGRVQVSGDSPDVPVRALVKEHDGDLWVVATATRLGETTARFAVDGAGSGAVEVVDEGRTLRLAGGAFEDAFAADYDVHIYRIRLD
jgi:hypothetical protein